MDELKRGQIKRIIETGMVLAMNVGLRDRISLSDLYKLAEAVKGEKLTTREKKRIAGMVSKRYPVLRKNKKKVVLIIT